MDAILNGIHTYVPKNIIRFNLKSQWFTPQLKHMLNKIHTMYKKVRYHPYAVN